MKKSYHKLFKNFVKKIEKDKTIKSEDITRFLELVVSEAKLGQWKVK